MPIRDSNRSMTSALRASVGLPVPVDRTFDYSVPAGMQLAPGVQVLVPYGPRQLTGVVVSLAPLTPAGTGPSARSLRPVTRSMPQLPSLSAELVRVVLECAAESLSPPGLALAAALPPGSAPRPTHNYSLTDSGARALARAEVPRGFQPLLEQLAKQPLEEGTLRRRFAGIVPELERLQRLGWVRREATTAPARARAKIERVYRLAPEVSADALVADLGRAPRQVELVRKLAGEQPQPLPASSALRSLIQAGSVVAELREVTRDVSGTPVERAQPAPALTPAQSKAVAEIEATIREPRCETFLLYGITGSGKTEVYLRACALALERERGVIVLVPEISLTHQLVARFRARFGDRVAVLHSALSASERLDQWRCIESGSQPIAIGARSAIFAPCARIGLIVIDEEHDASYQSEDGFRYDARELAAALARLHRCPLVLGSATPDITSAYRASKRELRSLVLPQRVASRPLPRVDIIDMERVRRAPGPARLLSQPLQRAVARTLTDGHQAILLLNRRGFATYVYCFHCGEGARCKHCDISLVYHATGAPARRDRPEQGELRCHYCGYTEEPRLECSHCGRADGALLGYGTERLEEEVSAMFPRARVARLDRDTSARKGAQEQILRAFHAGETDLLIGTQMVAKGHDIPNVTLVGVILADLGLHIPDFRAGERTFQLLTQVAGRAGRGDDPGHVLIQTFLPDHYAIALAKSHDYPSFFREELGRRELHGYPPFRSLVRVDISGADSGQVEQAAWTLAAWVRELGARSEEPGMQHEPSAEQQPAEQLKEQAGLQPELRPQPQPEEEQPEVRSEEVRSEDSVEVLGPAPAPLTRLRDQYRWQLLLLGPKAELLERGRQLDRRARKQLRSVQVRVVSAPVQML